MGSSRKKRKLCAIYWVLGNLHPKYRSTLHAIQLALLCKVDAIKEYGYDEFLRCLVKDVVSLEHQGVYIEQLGASIRGTVSFVVADNLAAHALGGFFESFTVSHVLFLYGHAGRNTTHRSAVRCIPTKNKRKP